MKIDQYMIQQLMCASFEKLDRAIIGFREAAAFFDYYRVAGPNTRREYRRVEKILFTAEFVRAVKRRKVRIFHAGQKPACIPEP